MNAIVDVLPSERLAISKVHIPLLLLCFAVALVDGFDTLSIAFAAPAIAAEWHVPTAAIGLLFSSGLLGGLAGAVVAPLLAARGGYRNGLIACVIWFAIGTLAINWAPGAAALLLLRFATGIGLGAAMALLCAAATEFFPAHFRSRAVSTMLIGMPVGGIVTGVLGAVLIPEHGWRSLFLIGGIAPICLVPFLASMMPRGGSGALMPKASGIGPWRDLFRGAPPSQTVITGAACFLGMLIAYSLANWAPTLLKSTNLSTKSAFLGASLLNMVSCFVMMSCGWLIDRFGLYRVAAIGFLVGAPFLVLIGFAQHLGPAALPVLIIGGLLILGTPVALPLLAADSYPPHLRVEAVSGYVAMSRSGAVIGPALAGVVIAYAGGIAAFFVMLALAAVVAGLAIIVLSRRKTAAAGLLEGL